MWEAMVAGKVCVLLLLAFALLSPVTDARKTLFNRPAKHEAKGHAHDSHEVRRMHKYVMRTRWMGVIVVRPAPCPAGQQIDMLGLCRPVVGRGGGPPRPPPALFISEYGQSYRDYDPHAIRDRPTRLARLDNTVRT